MSILDSLLTPKNVERGVNLLQSNKGIVDALAHNLTFLPASGRTFVKSLAGSTTPIDESYFSENQLAEIKNRTAKQMANRSMKYRPDDEYGFYDTWQDKNRVVPYDLSSPISLSGIFKDPKVDIDATMGTYVYRENPDGTVSAIDKHDFSTLEGGMEHLYGTGEGKDLGKGRAVSTHNLGVPQYKGEKGLPFLPPVDLYGDVLEKDAAIPSSGIYTQGEPIYESKDEVIQKVFDAYKNNEITASKFSRILAGLYGHQGMEIQPGSELFDPGQSDAFFAMRDDWDLTGIPVNINLGRISQLDKLKANPNFARYIATTGVIPSQIRKQAEKERDFAWEKKEKMRQQVQAADDRADKQNIQKIQQHTGRPLSDYRMSRPASERRHTGHGKSGMGRDRSELMATGGIVDVPLPGRSRYI